MKQELKALFETEDYVEILAYFARKIDRYTTTARRWRELDLLYTRCLTFLDDTDLLEEVYSGLFYILEMEEDEDD